MANLPLTRIEETAAEPQPAHINKRPKLASAGAVRTAEFGSTCY